MSGGRSNRVHPEKDGVRTDHYDNKFIGQNHKRISPGRDSDHGISKNPDVDLSQRSLHLSERKQFLSKNKLRSRTSRPVSGAAGLHLQTQKKWRKLNEKWNDFKFTMELWGSSLRSIEGHHGAAVASYFVFLRYLLLINVCLFLLSMFIWCPEAVHNGNALAANSTEESCTALYQVNVSSDAFTLILDFIQGSGWMEKTALFYGYYSGNGLSDTGYKLSLAYILVVIFSLVANLMLIAIHMGSSVRNSILNSGDSSTEFCNKVFGSWDYTLTDSASAKIKHGAICFELKSMVLELKVLKERAKQLQSRSKTCKLYTVRFLVNLFIVSLLGGAAYAIYYVTGYSSSYVSEHTGVTGTGNVLLLLLVQYLPSITITVLGAILPMIFQKIVLAEKYTMAFVLKITLVRTVFLRLASLAVLLITVYTQISCTPRDECRTNRAPCTTITCWETYVGQQLYKLIIMDLFVVVIKTLVVDLPRGLMYKKCGCGLMQKIGPPEFNLPDNVLDLVYSQCLYWLAMTFVPLTTSIAVGKVVLTFYIKKLSALKACPPEQKPSRTSRSNSFFMVILMVGFFLCSFPVGYTLYALQPSKGCGPFRKYNYIYDVITETVYEWSAEAQSFYHLIISPAVMGPVILFLCLMIYYCSTLSKAHKYLSDQYREQLVMEGREKWGTRASINQRHHQKPFPAISDLNSNNEIKKGKVPNEILPDYEMQAFNERSALPDYQMPAFNERSALPDYQMPAFNQRSALPNYEYEYEMTEFNQRSAPNLNTKVRKSQIDDDGW